MLNLLKNENITWKDKRYHLFRQRMTYIAIFLACIALGYIGYKLNKPLDWFCDRGILLSLAFTFRRALK